MRNILLPILLLMLSGCAQRQHVVERRSVDSVAAVARSATAITGRTRETEFIHEIIVMERDTASGEMVETKHDIIRTRGRETVADTTSENAQKTAVVESRSENEQDIAPRPENAVTDRKTRFWRTFAIVVFSLAAMGVIVLFLYIKFWLKWISRN